MFQLRLPTNKVVAGSFPSVLAFLGVESISSLALRFLEAGASSVFVLASSDSSESSSLSSESSSESSESESFELG